MSPPTRAAILSASTPKSKPPSKKQNTCHRVAVGRDARLPTSPPYSPSPSGRRRGEGEKAEGRTLAGPTPPYADVKIALTGIGAGLRGIESDKIFSGSSPLAGEDAGGGQASGFPIPTFPREGKGIRWV